MSVGETLISKVLDTNDVAAFSRFGVDREHFATELERGIYDFVREYAATNRGQAPSYAVVTEQFPDFVYIPNVTDSYEYLARKLKDTEGKRRIAEFMNVEVPKLFDSSDSETFISTLIGELESIKMRTSVRKNVGTDIKYAAADFLAEFERRRDGKSFKIWPSKFPSVNKAIGGGYFSGNVYSWFGRSGRGKSVLTMEDALEAACNGANVLVWAMEMSKYEWMARAYTSLSARDGIVKAMVDGVEHDAGFENRALLSGSLSEEFEEGLRKFASALPENVAGRIILRAVDDIDFRERSLRQLEADIIETKADVVVIDPIYYMDFEANTSRVAGGDVAATSKGLRRIAGATGAVIHVITQAEENPNEKADDGARELKPPKRADLKKSKAILEDSALVIAIDTLVQEGRGIIELGKGRNGGEDTRVEIIYLPNFGIIREIEPNADQFESIF
ncbi:DnaB-like helicase C-terminal domain-containing protein [Paenibacillus sediminis]|uniref:Replicative DNA helicase n=1 Tax=Paenibacillus sediminis TaxID=664909 RepID=A0ABS4H6N2_9BACL|nr:DnaB-like helicase C-terminal domain-containing protein [Paenibacillus sediminis]MBP1938136.1 replicative DNA helicase [Paenibacillus sediminis]